MFQIAAAMCAAKRNGTSAHYIGDNSHIRGFKLKGLNQANRKAVHKFNENMFSYDSSFEGIKNDTHLDGYFQSERYFSFAEDEVRKCFSFEHSVVDTAKNHDGGKYKRFFNGDTATALHIRRTDYLKYPDIYPEFNGEYYNHCLSRISEKGSILVFSDDLNWCQNNLRGHDFTFVDMAPLPSMYLMSNCKHIIMANSTFSWWAAWLGKPDVVICPKNWFGKKWPHQDRHPSQSDCTKDLFPANWQFA
jgi:hypothetical protein